MHDIGTSPHLTAARLVQPQPLPTATARDGQGAAATSEAETVAASIVDLEVGSDINGHGSQLQGKPIPATSPKDHGRDTKRLRRAIDAEAIVVLTAS